MKGSKLIENNIETKRQQQEQQKKIIKLYCLAWEAKETAEKIKAMTAYGSFKYNRIKINELNDKLYDLICNIQYINNIEE